jgi:hypothetical protein
MRALFHSTSGGRRMGRRAALAASATLAGTQARPAFCPGAGESGLLLGVMSRRPRAPLISKPRPARGGLSLARGWLLLGAALLGALGWGCGRKATVEDCQQIVKRIVELELGKTVPAQELGSEVAEAQDAMRQRALSDCVGRRITEKSLKCVSVAPSAEAVIDDCFD